MNEIEIAELVKQIPMYKVTSSNIVSMGYNEANKAMRVIFKGNSSYIYFNIEKALWENLIKSESKGKALNEHVVRNKDKYKFIKY